MFLAQHMPAQQMASMRWMLPALATTERHGLLDGLRADAPATAFDMVLGPAREVLDDDSGLSYPRGHWSGRCRDPHP